METTNNPMPQGQQAPMTPPAHHHKNWVVLLIFIVVALIVGVLLIVQTKWIDFSFPINEIKTNQDTQSFNNEVDSLNSDNLDAEFMDIEADLNSL